MPRRSHTTDGLEPIERASRDELESLQLTRLKWSVRHAYEHVPSYRVKCDAAGSHPDDLRSLADLARFPFTTKLDLRNGYPFGLFAVPRSQVVRVHASSGTTGKPRLIRGVNVFPSQIEELILRHVQLAPHYVLEVRREGALDQLTVKVEPHHDVAEQRTTCQQAATDLQREIKSYIGVSAMVVICDPGTVERSIGKVKRVIDARTHL